MSGVRATPHASTGRLYVVATPIGNLDDVTPRALETLRTADLVLAEDTRISRKLLARYAIARRLVSLHRYNESRTRDALVARLAGGERLALVCDAGTPTMSDPGARLVEAAHAAGQIVIPIPGPSAATAALSVSGLPADRFWFEGFLPSRRAARRRRLAAIAAIDATLVVFEAPHRALDALEDMADVLGDRVAVLCRELTKRFEEVRRATLLGLRDELGARDAVRGEIVLVVAGVSASTTPATSADEQGRTAVGLLVRLADALEHEEGDRRRAVKRLARELGIPRSEVKKRLEDAAS